MEKTHDAVVVSQFGSKAVNYVTSAVHAEGADLEEIKRVVKGLEAQRALDLGCGGGHVSFALAPLAGEVVAYDLSVEMLDAVRSSALQRGLSNITTSCGPAEKLPFENASFDVVTSRFSAHHWRDAARGLAEARRVLKPNGVALFVDVVAPEVALLDTFLQTIELLRDTSHVRDYAPSEWRAMLTEAGFAIDGVTMRRLPLEFSSWIARMRTPQARADVIRSLHADMADEVRAYFDLTPAGDFTVDTMDVRASVAAKL
jgi:ubiquinone/menaquinone biosynthesis C-methylase UbiE